MKQNALRSTTAIPGVLSFGPSLSVMAKPSSEIPLEDAAEMPLSETRAWSVSASEKAVI